jgi:hypothetical protein
MSENLQTTKCTLLEETETNTTVALSTGEKITLPKSLFPPTQTKDGYYFLTISNISKQEAVSKELAQNLLNEIINQSPDSEH